MTRAGAVAVAAVACTLLGSAQLEPPSLEAFPVRGIDVSHHQGEIDWSRVAEAGVAFAYIKATEGRDFHDPRFSANWAAAGAAGVLRGAYHFFTFCSDGRAQAEHFLRVAPPAPGALIPVADVEFRGNCKRWSDLGAVRAELAAFLDRVQRAWGVPPILYVTPDAHRRVLAGGFRSHPVWLRSVDAAPAPDAFGGWLLWQFSETGSVAGIRGPVDLNTLRPGVTVRALRTPTADLDPPGTEVIVTFGSLGFDPPSVEVRPGTRVTFHNLHPGEETYTVVAADGSFESWPLGPHGEWSHRFEGRGEHAYFLRERPEARGAAIVR